MRVIYAAVACDVKYNIFVIYAKPLGAGLPLEKFA